MSALNSPVPTKNSFETCEHNNSNLISAFSLSLSNISLSSGSFFLSTHTHTNKKKCKMKGGKLGTRTNLTGVFAKAAVKKQKMMSQTTEVR